MDYLYFKYLFFLLLILLVLYAIGAFLSVLLKLNFLPAKASVFGKLLLGLVFSVLLVSLYFTSFKTINLGLFLIIGFFLTSYYKNARNGHYQAAIDQPGFKIKEFVEVALVGFIFYNIRYFLSFQINGLPLAPHADYVYYAKISHFILDQGIESSQFNFVDSGKTNPYPYHYFELWFNGFISLITGKATLPSLVLNTYTVLSVLVWYSFISIAEKFTRIDLYTKIGNGLFLFLTGFLLPGLEQFPFFSSANVFMVNPITYPKLLSVYVFMGLSALFFVYKKYDFGFYSLLTLPIVFISTTPAVLSAVFLVNAIFYLVSSQDRKSRLYILGKTILVALFIGSFYFLFSRSDNSFHAVGKESFFSLLFSAPYLKTMVNIFVGASLQLLIIYFAVLLVIAFLFFRGSYQKSAFSFANHNNLLFCIVGALYVFGLLYWALIHTMLDSVQLFSNLAIPLIHFSVFLILLQAIENFKRLPVLVFAMVVILGINIFISFKEYRSPQLHDDLYLGSVLEFASQKRPLGAYIKDRTDYTDFFSKGPEFAILGGYLSYLGSDYHPVNISVFDIPLNQKDQTYKTEVAIIKLSPFHRFVTEQQNSGKFKSIQESQVEFIKAIGIDYLIVSKAAEIPGLLNGQIQKIITDNQSGERFILLK